MAFAILFAANLFAEKVEVTEIKVNECNVNFLGDKKSDYILIGRKADTKIDKIKSKIEKMKTIDNDKLSKSNDIIYIGKSKSGIKFANLKKETEYIFDLFKLNKKAYKYIMSSEVFTTLAEEPTKQSYNMAFFKKKETNMWVIVRPGNGKNRILLMKKDSVPTLPKDGTPIKAGLSRKNWQDLGNGTYVVYNSYKSTEKQVILEGLEPGAKYWFYALEYNGQGKSSNFNPWNGIQNPRSTFTIGRPPKINEATDITSNSFNISWEQLPNVIAYVIDVAKDESFENKVEYFDELDVENAISIGVDCDDSGHKFYYVRVLVYLRGGKTAWSEPKKVVLR